MKFITFLIALCLASVAIAAGSKLFSSNNRNKYNKNNSTATSVTKLGQYKISDITVSGLSSGGYMAVQMHVAHSSVINGYVQ